MIPLPSIPLSITPHDVCCEKFGKNIPLKPLPVSSFPQKCICNHVIRSWMTPPARNAKVPMHTTEVFLMVSSTKQEESTFRTQGRLFWMAGDFVNWPEVSPRKNEVAIFSQVRVTCKVNQVNDCFKVPAIFKDTDDKVVSPIQAHHIKLRFL